MHYVQGHVNLIYILYNTGEQNEKKSVRDISPDSTLLGVTDA